MCKCVCGLESGRPATPGLVLLRLLLINSQAIKIAATNTRAIRGRKKRLCVALAFFSAIEDGGGFVTGIDVYFVLRERQDFIPANSLSLSVNAAGRFYENPAVQQASTLRTFLSYNTRIWRKRQTNSQN